MAAPYMETAAAGAAAESFNGFAASSTSAIAGSETRISDSSAEPWHPEKHKL